MTDIYENMIFFAAFENKNLMYTKYNFDYIKYNQVYNVSPTINKVVIFKDFLNRNETTYDKPYSVKDNLKEYFTEITPEIVKYLNNYGYCIHSNYMHIVNPSTYIPYNFLVQDQFELIPYTDSQIQRLQDFFFLVGTNGIKRTKYNIDFVTYSEDFNVYGSKLLIFTDLVIRCLYLSKVIPGSYGYGLPSIFEKYFKDVPNLDKYLIEYGITSIYNTEYKNVQNIDWNVYKEKNPDIPSTWTNDECINHFYKYGQFEIREFGYNYVINPSNQFILNSICQIQSVGNNSIGSGFLYSPSYFIGELYLITCYHTIKNNPNKTTIRATFSYENTNDSLIEPVVTLAEFLIIGYDKFCDVVVAKYDPTLDWNINNNVNMSYYFPILLDIDYIPVRGDVVSYYGTLEKSVVKGCLTGNIIELDYPGPFTYKFGLGKPNSFIINAQPSWGVSGCPAFYTDETGVLRCIGMVNSIPLGMPEYTQAINGFLLSQCINFIINNYFYLVNRFGNNTQLIQYGMQYTLTANSCWFASLTEYYDNAMSKNTYKELYNFKYNGGIIISDFFLGFNPITRNFSTENDQISDYNTLVIRSPLINTKMYKRFLTNSMSPIVLKSVTFYNGLTGSYQENWYGKYGMQESFGNFTFGLKPLGTYNISDLNLKIKYSNLTYSLYPTLIIKYFYNNGNEWVEDEETLNFTTKDLVTYKDSLGNYYLQNPLEIPIYINPYLKPYHNYDEIQTLFKNSNKYWSGQSTSYITDAGYAGSDPSIPIPPINCTGLLVWFQNYHPEDKTFISDLKIKLKINKGRDFTLQLSYYNDVLKKYGYN